MKSFNGLPIQPPKRYPRYERSTVFWARILQLSIIINNSIIDIHYVSIRTKTTTIHLTFDHNFDKCSRNYKNFVTDKFSKNLKLPLFLGIAKQP